MLAAPSTWRRACANVMLKSGDTALVKVIQLQPEESCSRLCTILETAE